jgi:hypothetical protein
VNVLAALTPYGVVTSTFTPPAACAGETTVNDEPEATNNEVPATPSKVTDDAPARSVPVSVTVVPPATEPDGGETVDTAGGAT